MLAAPGEPHEDRQQECCGHRVESHPEGGDPPTDSSVRRACAVPVACAVRAIEKPWTAAEAAVEAGIKAAPVSAFCVNAHLPPGLVLGFASAPAAGIEAATDRLANALKKLARRGKKDSKHLPRAQVRGRNAK